MRNEGEGHQKSRLPKVARDGMRETDGRQKIDGEWFFVDIPLFHSRVFCFVGSRGRMLETAKEGIAKSGEEDWGCVAQYVENWIYEHGKGDGHTNGDSFGLEGTGIIRIKEMEIGTLPHMLVLNHESLHCALAIMDWVGVVEGSARECLCYTHEYIFGQLMEKMRERTGG